MQLPINHSKDIQAHNQSNFKHVFQQECEALIVSKHASSRMKERGIHISDCVWKEIEHKVKEAKQKGVTESVVITNDAALIVSTKNHTVITAMDKQEVDAHIFTNINGAIVMDS